MTVHSGSRYQFCEARVDDGGRLYLDERRRYAYRAFDDNVLHVVTQGETLWSIAAKYYSALERGGAKYWWAIADFQPQPVHDPTVALVAGAVVVVPSLRTLTEEILAESRRDESRV